MNEKITEILKGLECPEHPRFAIVGGHIFFDGLPISETIKSYLSFPHKGHRERRIEDFCAIARCWFEDQRDAVHEFCNERNEVCEGCPKALTPPDDYPVGASYCQYDRCKAQAEQWRALWLAVEGTEKTNGQ